MRVETAIAMIEHIDIIRSCFCSFWDIIPIYYQYYLCVIIRWDLVRGEGKKGIG
jgi:hypothetical protein